MVVHIYFHVFLVIWYLQLLCHYVLIKRNDLITNSPRVMLLYRYNTLLSHGLVNGVADWYMYVYMYCLARRTRCGTLWFYVFGEKLFFMTLLIFIHFVSDSIWKWHALLMYPIYSIEESDVSRENICYIIRYVKENNLVMKNIFIVCLLLQRRMTTEWSPLINICCSPFLRMFI